MQLVVGNVLFPASVQDADPFVSQGPDSLVMAHSFFSGLNVEGSRPEGVLPGFAGPFMEALADKVGAFLALVHPAHFGISGGSMSEECLWKDEVGWITIRRYGSENKPWKQANPDRRR